MIAGCGELHVEICLKDLKDAGRGFRIRGVGLGLVGLGAGFNQDADFFAVLLLSENCLWLLL